MSKTSANIIRDHFQCGVCMNEYNTDNKPMMICSNQHSICNNCLADLFKSLMSEKRCPFCR